MLIQYNAGRIVHIDNAVGRDLIARKLATEVVPPPKPVPNTTWDVCQGRKADQSPYIHAHCATCQQFAFGHGPKTSQTMKFLHCGIAESVPEYAAHNYDKQFRNWLRGDEPRPSSVSAAQREIEEKRRGAFRRI